MVNVLNPEGNKDRKDYFCLVIFWIIVKAELKKSWRNNNKMYTKEQNAEIEKVGRVFANYISLVPKSASEE